MSMMAPNIVPNGRGASVDAPPEAGADGKWRRCILSQRTCLTDSLIRFVVGPDNSIIPDVAERLPGRGYWLSANRGAVEQAVAERCFAKAARGAVTVDAALAEQVADLLAARTLNFLGLALRASEISIGHDQVRADLGAGRVAILIQASDGAATARARMRTVASDLPSVELFTRAELSRALGRADIVHAALHPSRLSSMFLRESVRLAGFRAIVDSRLPATEGDAIHPPSQGFRQSMKQRIE